MQKKEIKKLISLNVKDQPISSVLEQIQENLSKNLIFSRTTLADSQGKEHLITARIDKVDSESALNMVVKAVGMLIEVYDSNHLVIRSAAIDDGIDELDLDDEEMDEDDHYRF